VSGYFGETEPSKGWTPEQLRGRTLEANRGFESQKAAQEAAARNARFQKALEKFEKDADEMSRAGKNSAIGFECIAPDGAKTFDDLSSEDKAMFDRLRRHYEGRGFKTRVHGPYTDGGPSHVYIGFDLMVEW